MLICEAAGYDVIIVETVGVGQSEITVRSMVDFFLVLMLTGAGDELQGMKKGVMEIADALFINKADGPNKQTAENAKAEYNRLLHFLQPATQGWETKAYTISALTGNGIDDLWNIINKYKEKTLKSGVFQKRRQNQLSEWMDSLIEEQLKRDFYENPYIKEILTDTKKKVTEGTLPPAQAAEKLLSEYNKNK